MMLSLDFCFNYHEWIKSYAERIVPNCMKGSPTKSKEEESRSKKQIHSSVKTNYN